MSGSFNDLLSPLRRFRSVGDAVFKVLEGPLLPEPFRGLLLHNGDMTSRLQSFHRSDIVLEVLASERAGAVYAREVLLRSEATGAPVEYGAIEILLDEFEPELRRRILEGRVPLGGLLNASGLRYFSEPQAYFSVQQDRAVGELFGTSSETLLYGRCNVLHKEGGGVFACIVEVLPPVAEVHSDSCITK
ncbi:MAG: hypothetical protein EBS01_03630 [Verrucomicrobia bacterium]|nr:hypothetical protein [Verrucomicrobiota bacterium]